MTDSRLTELKHTTAAAVEMKSLQDGIDKLSQAFEIFSHETARLENSYEALQEKFTRINQKLEKSNRELHLKVSELDATSFYLNSLLNNISQGILFIKLSGVVSTYNPRAEEILGISQEKVLHSHFSTWFPDDLFCFSMKEALASKKAPETLFMTLSTIQGTQKELELSVKFDLKGDDASNGLIVLIRDITEMRRLQAIANRHYRMEELGEMAASLAHEIRNPLGGIEGFASLLHRDLNEMPEKQKMASAIIDGTRTLSTLVTNVLHYARPIKLRFATTDLVLLLKQVLELVKADSTYSQEIEYHLKFSASSILAPVDEEVLKTALLNLVVNAVQAMPQGGSLYVDLIQKNEFVTISITDTGEGISEENIEKIFSPFFTTKEEGNGLGLSEVQKVIQAHGGNIQVSSNLGKGSRFTIKLPLAGK
jgi:PAS domain S-box-containing protein